jgi:hypothetical protein
MLKKYIVGVAELNEDLDVLFALFQKVGVGTVVPV